MRAHEGVADASAHESARQQGVLTWGVEGDLSHGGLVVGEGRDEAGEPGSKE